MKRITSNTLMSIWGKTVCIAPRRVRIIAAFLAVALLALCAFYPSSPALAQPHSVSEPSLGSGASKTFQPPAVSANAHPAQRLIFIGDSLTAGFFAHDPAHGYAALTASALHVRYSVQSQYGVTAMFTARKMQASKGLAVPADTQEAVIELGTNDVFASGETFTQFRTAYDYILTRVRHDAPQAKIVCLGTWRAPAQGGRFDEIIRSDCVRLVGGSYVGLSRFYLNATYRGPAGRVTAFGTSDDFHPNNAGHKAISTALLAALSS